MFDPLDVFRFPIGVFVDDFVVIGVRRSAEPRCDEYLARNGRFDRKRYDFRAVNLELKEPYLTDFAICVELGVRIVTDVSLLLAISTNPCIGKLNVFCSINRLLTPASVCWPSFPAAV